LEDDFEGLEVLGVLAGDGFVERFVAAVTFFVGRGDLQLLKVPDGFAADEVEALGLKAEIEGEGFGGRESETELELAAVSCGSGLNEAAELAPPEARQESTRRMIWEMRHWVSS
jgi:hypothetical protein